MISSCFTSIISTYEIPLCIQYYEIVEKETIRAESEGYILWFFVRTIDKFNILIANSSPQCRNQSILKARTFLSLCLV